MTTWDMSIDNIGHNDLVLFMYLGPVKMHMCI